MTRLSRILLACASLFMLSLMIGVNLAIDRHESAQLRIEAVRQANRLKWELYFYDMNKWIRRDVVSVFYIDNVEFDGATVTIWGYLEKRGCPLNIPPDGSPYSVIDFVDEDAKTRVGDRLYYQFGDDEASKRPVSRPPGATAIKGWKITLSPNFNEDHEVVGYATHNCGVVKGDRITVGPREFLRVKISDLLNPPFKWVTETAMLPKPVKPGLELEVE